MHFKSGIIYAENWRVHENIDSRSTNYQITGLFYYCF